MLKPLLLLAPVVLFSGCMAMQYQPYAREVLKKPHVGGTIAMHINNRPEDRARADYLMAANCGDEATANVTQEGETVVGEHSESQGNRYRDNTLVDNGDWGALHFGEVRPSVNTQTSTDTVQVKEWRIDYTCVPNGPMAKPKRKKAAPTN